MSIFARSLAIDSPACECLTVYRFRINCMAFTISWQKRKLLWHWCVLPFSPGIHSNGHKSGISQRWPSLLAALCFHKTFSTGLLILFCPEVHSLVQAYCKNEWTVCFQQSTVTLLRTVKIIIFVCCWSRVEHWEESLSH